MARTPSGSTSTSPTAKTRRRCKRSSSIDGARRDQSGPARVAARAGPAHLAVPQVPAPDLQPRARVFAGVRGGNDRAAHRPGGAAGGHGLGRQADRRRGGGGGARRRSRAALAGPAAGGARSGLDGGLDRDVPRTGALARPDARLARQPRQHLDPGEGRYPRAAPFRGRRFLRQDAERASRGEHPAPEHGAGDGFAAAAVADPRQLCGAVGASLALVGIVDRRRLGALVHRRSALLRGVVPPQYLARARGPEAELSGVDPHPRLSREGSEAVRSGAAGPAPLPGAFREVLRRGSLARAAQGRGRARARIRLPHRVLRRVRVHGGPGRDGGDHARRSHPLPLRLAAGEKMALVGENGAGKSTLIKLLMRLYDPSEGSILYGGTDLRDMDVRDLRDRIGVLFQDFVRYQWTARENVGIGWVPALEDRARVERAIEDGGARSVIEQLPQKIDTMLGGWFEEGHELSGGQWQKIALARAFMRDSEVLVLVEPTASLDAEAEHELFVRLQQLAADRTAILISHRFSTVRRADRIAVLQEGRVEELGTHEELLARNGRYAHLFRLQASGYVS